MDRWCGATGCLQRSKCTLEVDGREESYRCAEHAAEEITRAVQYGYKVFVVITEPKGKKG